MAEEFFKMAKEDGMTDDGHVFAGLTVSLCSLSEPSSSSPSTTLPSILLRAKHTAPSLGVGTCRCRTLLPSRCGLCFPSIPMLASSCVPPVIALFVACLARSCGTAALLPRAFGLFAEMKARNVTTGEQAYHDLVCACCDAGDLDKAMEVMATLRRDRILPSVVRAYLWMV